MAHTCFAPSTTGTMHSGSVAWVLSSIRMERNCIFASLGSPAPTHVQQITSAFWDRNTTEINQAGQITLPNRRSLNIIPGISPKIKLHTDICQQTATKLPVGEGSNRTIVSSGTLPWAIHALLFVSVHGSVSHQQMTVLQFHLWVVAASEALACCKNGILHYNLSNNSSSHRSSLHITTETRKCVCQTKNDLCTEQNIYSHCQRAVKTTSSITIPEVWGFWGCLPLSSHPFLTYPCFWSGYAVPRRIQVSQLPHGF